MSEQSPVQDRDHAAVPPRPDQPTEPLLEEAIHLSFATGLSLYDCAYMALAKELDAALITADAQLSRAASKFVHTTILR